jgi:hypothetical protein
MLEATIPAICRDASLSLAAKGWLFQPSSIPQAMALVAISRLEKGPDLLHNPDRTVFKVLARKFSAKYPGNTDITRELLKAFNKSLEGVFRDEISKEEAQDLATCMHTVQKDTRFKGPCNPGYRCDCKRFVYIGLCSCVLMVAQFVEKINLYIVVDRCPPPPLQHIVNLY